MKAAPAAKVFIATVAAVAVMIGDPAFGQVSEVLWSQPWNSNYAAPESIVTTNPAASKEAADDFELHGTVQRLVIAGHDCFNCGSPDVAGVFVRFYEWTATGPGAMLVEQFLADGDADFLYSASGPATLDITLPQPFEASGKYFVSVQLSINGGGYWGWWVANHNSAQGSPLRYRTNGGPWGPYITPLNQPLNADLSFMIWGDDGTPPPPGNDPCGQWQVLDTPHPADITDHAVLRDVVALAGDDVWAVGEYTTEVQGDSETRTMALHFDGAAWTVVPSPSPSPYPGGTWATFDAVAAAGPNDIWAAGGKNVQAPDGFLGTQILAARYNGTSWQVMNTPLTIGGSGSNVADIEIISPDNIWFFGDWMGINGVGAWNALAMHWNGSTFTVHQTPFPAGGTPGWGLMAGSAIAPNDIWAVGGGSDNDYSATGYIIHWDGNSWTRVLGPTPGALQRLYDVKMIASDDVWAVGDYLVAGQGYFPLFLHWDGTSWTQVPSPGGGRSLVVFAPDNIYSGGAGIVHWDGKSWQLVESFNSVIGPSISAISAASLCDMFAVGRQLIVGDVLNFSARLQPGAVGGFPPLSADINNDGVVNVADLLVVINEWGACPVPPALCPADVTGDGAVDVQDLLLVINHWV